MQFSGVCSDVHVSAVGGDRNGGPKDLWSAGNAGKPKRGHRCGEYEKFDDVSAGRRKEADRFLWTGCPVRR